MQTAQQKKNDKFQSLLILLTSSLADNNDNIPFNQPNAYQSNSDLPSKYQQDEIVFQDMTKDGGNENKYNVDGSETQQRDADSFLVDNYGSRKYYDRDSIYALENPDNRGVRSISGKFNFENVRENIPP